MAYPTEVQLVTDRTASDVQARNSKGTYNVADLNRVETAVAYLSNLLQQLPSVLKEYREARQVADSDIFDIPYDASSMAVTTKTDWVVTDIPRPEDMTRYLGNVTKIRAAFGIKVNNYPSSMTKLTRLKANAIERALVTLYDKLTAFEKEQKDLADRAQASVYYSGEIYGGDV